MSPEQCCFFCCIKSLLLLVNLISLFLYFFIKSSISSQNEDGTKVEYRVWNPFRSKLAAAILGGVDDVWIVSFIHEIVY